MRGQNNVGRQYTDAPNFGKTFPNTQYKGYSEEEGTPYGNANSNTRHQAQFGNQYGYTSQYQGNHPYHFEDRFNQIQPMTPPQNRSGMSQLQYRNESSSYPVDRYQGLSQYQSGTITAQGLSQYESGSSGMHNQTSSSGNQYQGMGQPIAQTSNNMYGTGSHEQLEKSGQINTAKYNDRDRINDLLASEKYLTEGYNISTFEATNPQLHSTLSNILNETHRNREQLFNAMEQRGWYKTEQADHQQVIQAYNKFNEYKSQLPY